MKIGVVSDSHGYTDRLLQAVDGMGDVDLIVHCGDHSSDAQDIRAHCSIPVMAVNGNCDPSEIYDDSYPDLIETNIGGHHVLIVHGHKQFVKRNLDDLLIEAKTRGADLVLFGHTHVQTVQEKDGVLMVNPGSCALPNASDLPQYAIVDLDGDPKVDLRSFEPNDPKDSKFWQDWFI